MRRDIAIAGLMWVALGCGPVEEEACDRDAAIASAIGANTTVSGGTIEVRPGMDAEFEATLDASLGGTAAAAQSSYLYLDLGTGELLDLSDVSARTSTAWTIGFNRTNIILNSGNSGAGAMRLAKVTGVSFEDASAPGDEAMWRVDDFLDDACEVKTFGDTIPGGDGFIDTAFGFWFAYEFDQDHRVSAPDQTVYFVQDQSSDVTYKFEIVDFLDRDPNDELKRIALYELRWQKLP